MALTNGYNVVVKQVTQSGNTPLYPSTRAKNVWLDDGTNLETAIGSIEQAIENIEDDYVLQTQIGAAATTGQDARKGVAELDTNALVPATQLPAATASVKGAVKIADALPADSSSDASDVAASEVMLRSVQTGLDSAKVDKTSIGVATSGGVKGVAELDTNGTVPTAQLPAATASAKGAVKIADALPADSASDASDVAASEVMLRAALTSVDNTYVKLSQLGVASVQGGATGVATLGTDGKVPSTQLPSYVDDVIEGYYKTDDGKFYKEDTYTTEITPEASKIYIDLNTDKTYRWGGSQYVVISETLALGTTHQTAAYGDEGLIAYRHAMNLNTSTGEPETNHNPHGLTQTDINTLIGYTPVAPTDLVTASTAGVGGNNGLFRATDYESFNNMKEIIVSTTAQGATFASGSGLWIEVISEDVDPEP